MLIPRVLLVLAVLAVPPSARADEGYGRVSADIMSTRIDVIAPSERVEEAGRVVFGVFSDVDARMSEWKPTSRLSAVNFKAGGAPVEVPEDLFELIRRGLQIGRITEGAYDITWAALWGLWDFNAEHPEVPEPEEARRRAALVDFRKVELDPARHTVRLPEQGMKIGLGGIAKGHSLERAAAALLAKGITSFTLSAGGQVYAAGLKGDRPWRVGVRDPRGGPDDYFAVVEASDCSVSTSGDYERYFMKDGVRYHHIIDPRTGMPARGLRSATIVSRDATLADALSTAVMVLGRERGLALVEGLIGVEAVLVDVHGQVSVSSGLRDRLEMKRPPREGDAATE